MDPKQLSRQLRDKEHIDQQQATISQQMTLWAKKQMTKSNSALKVELSRKSTLHALKGPDAYINSFEK